MNHFEKFLSLCVCVVVTQTIFVNSQHPVPSISEQLQRLQNQQNQQNQQPQKESEGNELSKKQTVESVSMPHSQYNYRQPANQGYNTYQGYPRDLYQPLVSQSTVPAQPKGNIFQIASGGDYFLTGQFSQMFYSFVTVVVVIAIIVFVVKYLGLAIFDFGGIFQKLKDGSATGKSLDLNRITDRVLRAIDTYENSGTKLIS